MASNLLAFIEKRLANEANGVPQVCRGQSDGVEEGAGSQQIAGFTEQKANPLFAVIRKWVCIWKFNGFGEIFEFDTVAGDF